MLLWIAWRCFVNFACFDPNRSAVAILGHRAVGRNAHRAIHGASNKMGGTGGLPARALADKPPVPPGQDHFVRRS